MQETQKEIKLAQGAQEEVKAAEPSQEEAARFREQLKREMLTTISEMRAAIQRVGPLGMQVGNGDHSVFILREPLVSAKPIYQGGKDETYHTYVVATASGFKGIEIISDPEYPYQWQDEQNLLQAFNSTKDGMIEPKGQAIPGYWNHAGVREVIAVPKVGGDWTVDMGSSAGEILVPLSPDQVTLALRGSIAKAQAPYKTEVIGAKISMEIAQNVQAGLKG